MALLKICLFAWSILVTLFIPIVVTAIIPEGVGNWTGLLMRYGDTWGTDLMVNGLILHPRSRHAL